MALPSGLGQTTAIAEESTYGTVPTLTGARGYYVNSNSLQWTKNVVQGEGLRGSSLLPYANRRVTTSRAAEGDIEMDMAVKGMGLWLKHGLGNAAIAQVGVTPAFTQTFTLGSLSGRSLTVQRGIPLTDGSLQPWTFSGCKITTLSIAADNQDICKLTVSLDARDATLGVGYATPSFTLADAAPTVFSFAGAALYVAGSGTPVASNLQFGLEVNHALKTDRYHTGTGGLKGEPLNNGYTEAVMTVEQEYADNVTWVARHFSDETFRLVQRYDGPVISGSTTYSLIITAPAVKIDTESPAADGLDVVTHTLSCPVLNNGVDEPLTVEYVSTDTAV